MAMNVTPFVGTDNFNMETFNNMISQINNGVNSEISEVLAQLGTKAKIQTGSYIGTGTYGASNPCSLTFDFVPKIMIMSAFNRDGAQPFKILGYAYSATQYIVWDLNGIYATLYGEGRRDDAVPKLMGGQYQGNDTITLSISQDGKTLSWYSETNFSDLGTTQYNKNGAYYYYMVIGT